MNWKRLLPRRKRKLFLLSIAFFLLGAVLSAAIFKSSTDLPLRMAEEKLGTDGELNWSFHRVLEEKERIGFRFPGFLVGIEKADEDVLEISSERSVFDVAALNDGRVHKVREALNDSGRLFLSHLVQYSFRHDRLPRISTNVLYSAYETNDQKQERTSFGNQALTILRNEMSSMLRQGDHTHIIFISMGWNTPQLEAIGDMNSIVGQLMRHIDERDAKSNFRPLIIGLTWPSRSSVAKVNYISKAYDADELGLVWINRITNEVVAPLKEEFGVKVTYIGHSLGARAMSMGMFAAFWDRQDKATLSPVDLFVGYEPAFSINRFIPEKGIEDAPYADYQELGTRFVLTWSKHDSAMNVGRFYLTSHVGGEAASAIAAEHPTIFSSLSYTDAAFDQGLSDGSKVHHVDVSTMLRHETFESSGGAHSDIFRDETAEFLWRVMQSTGTVDVEH